MVDWKRIARSFKNKQVYMNLLKVLFPQIEAGVEAYEEIINNPEKDNVLAIKPITDVVSALAIMVETQQQQIDALNILLREAGNKKDA